MAFEQAAQALEVIKAPYNTEKILSVKRQESQLRVFTETYDKEELQSEQYYINGLLRVMKTRSESKFDRVLQFFRYPLPTVQIADAILNDFYKIFDGKNRYFDVQGDRDITRLKDWIREFDPQFWIEQNIKDVFKNKPNSFVVVDADENGPYLINIDSNRLVDVKFADKYGNLDYIAFIHSIGKNEIGKKVIFYAVYDSEYYRVFSKVEGQEVYNTVVDQKHNIGYCPAKSFISSPSSDKNLLKRRVAFSDSLSRLEDYTIFDVFRNYVDHYAPFPVTEAPETPCQNQECVSGKVPEQVVEDPKTDRMRTVWSDCKVCDGGKNNGVFTGPGLHIAVPVSEDRNKKDASGVFKMHFPETDTLEYTPKKLDALAIEIKNATVGVNGMISAEAINEMQAKGGFESMESVTIRNKGELDTIYKWTIETVGRWFYRDIMLNVEANYGTEFYLITETELQARFKEAKEIGLPIEEQMEIYIQLIETKYKGNTAKIERQKLLLMLDPLPLVTTEQALELASNNLITTEVLSLKINFLNLISRFETENGPLTQFGINLELPQRLEIIKNTLNNFNSSNNGAN